MRTSERPQCPICAAHGRAVYSQLGDPWFGAPGQWRMKQCIAPACGALWLDPAPHPDSLAEVYAGYHTHADAAPARTTGLRDLLYASYAALRLGYPPPAHRAWRVLAWAVSLWPKRAEIARATCLHLPYVGGGRALDVGCGAGRQLSQLSVRGWTVMGLEPDDAAAQVARAKGYEVQAGDLTTVTLPPASFDAIVMSHVLEHLPQPREHLLRARALLRVGGRLVVLTPNACSLGHRIYGSRWRGLEPPRHLQIFTPPSLRVLLTQTGFQVDRVTTSARNAAQSFAESATATSDAEPRADHRALEAIERMAVLAGFPIGDELIAVARRPA